MIVDIFEISSNYDQTMIKDRIWVNDQNFLINLHTKKLWRKIKLELAYKHNK